MNLLLTVYPNHYDPRFDSCTINLSRSFGSLDLYQLISGLALGYRSYSTEIKHHESNLVYYIRRHPGRIVRFAYNGFGWELE